MEVDAQGSSNAGVCVGYGKRCVYGVDRCCGATICQPEYVCIRAPCPAPWVCR